MLAGGCFIGVENNRNASSAALRFESKESSLIFALIYLIAKNCFIFIETNIMI